jgi:acyl carrier protein
MTASDEIRARVTKVLVEALGVDESDVTPSATLLGDLGAESIDFLDIVFRLERGFGIKIPRGELFIEPVFQDDVEFVADGELTEDGLDALRSQMPYADFSHLVGNRRLNKITDVFTVDLLVQYVKWKLEGRADANGSDAADLVAPGTSAR